MKIIAYAGLTIILVLTGIYAIFEIQFLPIERKVKAEQVWILYHVDHQILAAEARKFGKEQRSLGVSLETLEADDPKVPAALAILKPRRVEICDGFVRFEFGGFFLHYGIDVYDEGLEGPGTKNLAEGVWFYSENGRYPGPNGEKKKGPPRG
jgi:hypothetical protein